MEYPDPEVPVPTDLTPCPICGRTFRPDALTRHHRVCEKNAAKKRKVFDSSKQRALEDAAAHPKPEPAPKKPPAKAKVQRKQAAAAESKPKTNWREKHEDLINTIKQARGEEVKQPPTANGEPVKKKVPSDYVQCEACGRHFNQRAAERHIPWCQKKKSETPQSKSAPVDAKEKLIARVRYRPPQGRSSRPAHRKTKTVDAVASVDVQRRPPAASVPARGVAVVRSSPPNLVDKRNSRNASLDRNNNNNSGGNSNNNNNANVTNANWGRRSGSRSREKPELTLSSPDLTAHIIKFKEKFPNSKKKRNGDLEESLTSEQLRELLSCSRITDRCPRTVPGVRLSSQQNRNDNWNYNNPEVIRSASSSGGSSNGWNKRSVVRSTLPEVSSSEWGPKVVWGTGDLSDSACSTGGSSSSGSSLPPLSRENNMEMTQGAPNCHLCRSPFPMASAKYCCECGARRRGVGCINQTG